MSKGSELLSSIFEEDEELLADIGRVVAVWGSIHDLLRSLAARQLGVSPDNTDILLKGFSGEGAKIEFLIGLISMRNDIGDKSLLKCLRTLSGLAKERNVIIHGGPIKGGKIGGYDFGYHFVNYRKYKIGDTDRVNKAKPFVSQHLLKLRVEGSSLWNLLFADEIKLLDDADKWKF